MSGKGAVEVVASSEVTPRRACSRQDRLEGEVVAVEEGAAERAVGVDVHQAREQEGAGQVAPLDVHADVAVAADRFDAPAGDQQHAVVGHPVGQHQPAAAPGDARRGGAAVRSAHELTVAGEASGARASSSSPMPARSRSSARWQATKCPGRTSRSAGVSRSQASTA